MTTPLHSQPRPLTIALLVALVLLGMPSRSEAASGPDSTLQNFTGGSVGVCPCFIPGEQAGVVLFAPASHYPIEILRVGIGWGSQFGGAPNSLEQAIHIYDGSLPDPGTPIFTQAGPLLTDGFINEFNFEPVPGQIVIPSGSFTVTLEFANQNSGNIFAPSVMFDAGCQPQLNVVKADPGGWADACVLGVTGDWVMYVVYRACNTTVGVGDGPLIAASQPVMLMPARPNPFTSGTSLDFFLAEPGQATINVYDVAGRRVAALANGAFSAGTHPVTWNGRSDDGGRLNSGTYFVELESGEHRSLRKVVLTD